VAAATGLASAAGRVPAAIIALTAAGLTAAATFLNSDQRGTANDALGGAWQELADNARMAVLDLDARSLTGRDVGDTLLRLHRRKSQLLRGDHALDVR
jgi:hypothetical protein